MISEETKPQTNQVLGPIRGSIQVQNCISRTSFELTDFPTSNLPTDLRDFPLTLFFSVLIRHI